MEATDFLPSLLKTLIIWDYFFPRSLGEKKPQISRGVTGFVSWYDGKTIPGENRIAGGMMSPVWAWGSGPLKDRVPECARAHWTVSVMVSNTCGF